MNGAYPQNQPFLFKNIPERIITSLIIRVKNFELRKLSEFGKDNIIDKGLVTY